MLDNGVMGSILPEDGMVGYRIHEIIGYNDMNDPIFDETGKLIAKLSNDWAEPTHVFGGMKLNMPITENNVMLTLRCARTTHIDDKKTWHVGGIQLGDPEAAWDKPLKLKVDEFYHYGLTNAREMTVSVTEFKYTQYLAE